MMEFYSRLHTQAPLLRLSHSRTMSSSSVAQESAPNHGDFHTAKFRSVSASFIPTEYSDRAESDTPYHWHDSPDSSDSPSAHSPSSSSSNSLHSPYRDDPRLNGDHAQPLGQYHSTSTKDRKSPRRKYFDYGITVPSHFVPPSLPYAKHEDNQDLQTKRFPSFTSYARFFSPNAYSLWDLPSPSHARTSMLDRADVHEKDTRMEPPSFYHSQPFWLTLYFFFNLGLTLYNKMVLIHFPYAYALTALHALCGSIGGFALLRLRVYVPAKLTDGDNMALLAFSLLYTINIAVSNLSLELVTVPFHQVVRAATPIFTVLLAMFLFGARSSKQKIASLAPVVAGVGLATYGDYYFTTSGFLLTLLGTLLAAIKTIYTSILQSPPSSSQAPSPYRYLVPPRLQLHPLDLLTRMAPLAFIQCVILSYMSGELDRVRQWSARELTPLTAVALGLNGAIAFGLNIVSFTANKKAGPLSMTVAANVKQVLSIILAVMIFELSISAMNALGIMLTLAGGAWYASVEYQEKKTRAR